MARGRPLNPELARYRVAGRQKAVYLLEYGQHVKVGCSVMPAVRLSTLHAQARRTSTALGRFSVFPIRDGHDLANAECLCIHALQAVATPLPGRREHFAGISFDDATALVFSALAHAARRPLHERS